MSWFRGKSHLSRDNVPPSEQATCTITEGNSEREMNEISEINASASLPQLSIERIESNDISRDKPQQNPTIKNIFEESKSQAQEDAFTELHQSILEIMSSSNNTIQSDVEDSNLGVAVVNVNSGVPSDTALSLQVEPPVLSSPVLSNVESTTIFSSDKPSLLSVSGTPLILMPDTQLDVIYLTQNLFLSGLPWTRRTEKCSHRNNADELASFLDETIGRGRYLVVYIAEDETINATPFHHQIVSFPLNNASTGGDASSAFMLTIDWLLDIIFVIDAFIRLGEPQSDAVVLLLDRHGYGTVARMVASAYLRYINHSRTCSEAWSYIVSKTEASSLSVTEKRFLQYFDDLLKNRGYLSSNHLQLHRVIVNSVPTLQYNDAIALPLPSSQRSQWEPYLPWTWEEMEPRLEIWQNGKCIYSSHRLSTLKSPEGDSSNTSKEVVYVDAHHLMFLVDRPVERDVQLRLVYPKSLFLKRLDTQQQERNDANILASQSLLFSMLASQKNTLSVPLFDGDCVVFKFSFHGGFVSPGVIRINASHIEPCTSRKYSLALDTNFSVDLIFFQQNDSREEKLQNSSSGERLEAVAHKKFPSNDLHYVIRLNRSMMLGLTLLIERHHMAYSEEYARVLQEQGYKRLLVQLALIICGNDLHNTHEYLAKNHAKIIEKISHSIFKESSVVQDKDGSSEFSNLSTVTNNSSTLTSLVSRVSDEYLFIAEKNDAFPSVTQNTNFFSRNDESPLHTSSLLRRVKSGEFPSQSEIQYKSMNALYSASTAAHGRGGEYDILDNYRSSLQNLCGRQIDVNNQLNTPGINMLNDNSFDVKEHILIAEGQVSSVSEVKKMGRTDLSIEKTIIENDVLFSSNTDPSITMLPPPLPASLLSGQLVTINSNSSLKGGSPPPPPPPLSAPLLSSMLGGPSLAEKPLRARKRHSVLRWQAINVPDNRIKDTVWFEEEFEYGQLSEDQRISLKSWRVGEVIDLDMIDKLKQLFVIPQSTVEKSSGSAFESSLKSRMGPLNLLEVRRANNIAIGLRKFLQRNMSYFDIRTAIISFRTEILNLDDLITLLPLMPTLDEIQLFKQYTGSTFRLGESEKFLIEMMKTAQIQKYLEVSLFLLQAPADVNDIYQASDDILKSCIALQESKNLKSLLQLILKLGKVMQDMGNIDESEESVESAEFDHDWNSFHGFRLGLLLKLKDIKSQDGKMSFLEYLALVIDRHFPQLKELPMEFSCLSQLQNHDTQELAARLKSLESQHASLVIWLRKIQQSVTDDVNFFKCISQAISAFDALSARLSTTRESINRMSSSVRIVVIYFGEDEKDMKFEYLLKILSSFFSALAVCFEKESFVNK